MNMVEITNISIGTLAPGLEAQVSFTLKNISGGRITSLSVALVADARDFQNSTATSFQRVALGYVVGKGMTSGETVNLANNASRSFSGSITVNASLADYFAAAPQLRAVPVYIAYNAPDQNMGEYEKIAGHRLLNCIYAPLAERFSLERAIDGRADDEGESLLADLHIGAEYEGCERFFQAELYYAQNVPADITCPCIDLTARLPELLAGVSGCADLITQTFSNGSDWHFLLVVGDHYESVQARTAVFRAFANMHLSGMPTGGVCFGGFSASGEGAPLLESHYPARLYGGVEEVGGSWIPLTPLAGTSPGTYGGPALRCRRIEKRCIVDGSVQVKPGSSTLVLAQLPQGYVPDGSVYRLNACSGARVARISVSGMAEDNPGELALDWVRSLSDGSLYTSGEIWVQCSIEFWAE